MGRSICLSIVSHGQEDLINNFLLSLSKNFSKNIKKIIITHNLTNKKKIYINLFKCQVIQIYNNKAKGFAANHNQAFQHCCEDYFLVCNPDIIIKGDVINTLIKIAEKNDLDFVSPAVKNFDGTDQLTARKYPSFYTILKKGLKKFFFNLNDLPQKNIIDFDWIAGMFYFIKSTTFLELNGLFKYYFLYYEDVDLFLKIHKYKKKAMLVDEISVYHDKQEYSHKKFKYTLIHLLSFFIFKFRQITKLY